MSNARPHSADSDGAERLAAAHERLTRAVMRLESAAARADARREAAEDACRAAAKHVDAALALARQSPES